MYQNSVGYIDLDTTFVTTVDIIIGENNIIYPYVTKN